ncbi:hypothetical protein LV78_001295 [Actinosynnema pretiosum]|nr:hypothetical protein [Actinosynnema pretiosum]
MPDSQAYDPYVLLDDVVKLLSERGLSPQRNEESSQERIRAACALLAGLGIEPRLAQGATPDLDGNMNYNRRIHGD